MVKTRTVFWPPCSDLTPRCYLNNRKPRLLRPALPYLPPITIGAFCTSGFHPLVLDPVNAIKNARQKIESIKDDKKRRNDFNDGDECEEKRDDRGRLEVGNAQAHPGAHLKIDQHTCSLCGVGVSGRSLPFLSHPHPELLHSPFTIQNERRTHFSKRSGHCCERGHVLCS
jgi:hypothetical protein